MNEETERKPEGTVKKEEKDEEEKKSLERNSFQNEKSVQKENSSLSNSNNFPNFILQLKNNENLSIDSLKNFKKEFFLFKSQIEAVSNEFLQRANSIFNKEENEILRENVWRLVEEKEMWENEYSRFKLENSQLEFTQDSPSFLQSDDLNHKELHEGGEEEGNEKEETEYERLIHLHQSSNPEEETHGFEEMKREEGEEETFNIHVGFGNGVEEKDLNESFKEFGEIVKVSIFRDTQSGESRNFGFVHFKEKEAQEKALEASVTIKGFLCKISKSEEKTVLFVGNLPHDMNHSQVKQALQDILGSSLPIQNLELKTKPPPLNESRGFCFVQMGNHAKAEQAKKILTSAKMKGQTMNVSWAENRTNATQEVDEETMSKVKTLFVNDIPTSVSDSLLHSHFIEFGEIVNCGIVKSANGQSRGFAFIEFKKRSAAEAALSQNGKEIMKGNCLSVQLAKPAPSKPSFIHVNNPNLDSNRRPVIHLNRGISNQNRNPTGNYFKTGNQPQRNQRNARQNNYAEGPGLLPKRNMHRNQVGVPFSMKRARLEENSFHSSSSPSSLPSLSPVSPNPFPFNNPRSFPNTSIPTLPQLNPASIPIATIPPSPYSIPSQLPVVYPPPFPPQQQQIPFPPYYYPYAQQY